MYYFWVDVPIGTVIGLNVILSTVIVILLIWMIKKGGKR
jgi:hypothetical protein